MRFRVGRAELGVERTDACLLSLREVGARVSSVRDPHVVPIELGIGNLVIVTSLCTRNGSNVGMLGIGARDDVIETQVEWRCGIARRSCRTPMMADAGKCVARVPMGTLIHT